MKVILTGATGFIGSAVLGQCISNPKVTSIVVLSRKPLAGDVAENPKVRVLLHQDFSIYPSELIEQLRGAQGCIWAIGGKIEDFPNLETARHVSIDLTLAAAKAFAESLLPARGSEQPFRFVFCSGQGAEWNQEANLRIFSDTRKMKGVVEKGLFDIALEHPGFEAIALRPGGVLSDEKNLLNTVASKLIPTVTVTILARGLLGACLTPPVDKIVENKDIEHLAQ